MTSAVISENGVTEIKSPEQKTEVVVDNDALQKTSMSSKTRSCSEIPLLDVDVETKGSAEVLAALTDEEKQHMPDENMPLRHFRAEKGNVKDAIKKIKEAIAWRREFGVEAIRDCFTETGDKELASVIKFENTTGKVYARGYTREGRAILYLKPGLENSKNEDDNMKHLVYNIERAIACTEKNGKEKYVILINYEGWSISKAPSLSASRQTLKILQHHYPERLYRSYILNPPMVFRTFWSLIKPFIDPNTKEKIQFCTGKGGKSTIEKDIDLAKLEPCAYGTSSDMVLFDSKTYLESPINLTYDE